MSPIVDRIALAAPAARDPTVVGAKAAALASAAAEGLPVLPGEVVPLVRSEAAVTAGAAARVSGQARAYLAATAAGAEAATAVAAGIGDGPWVARSSTPFDDDGRWAGAFASYLDVGAADVPAAIRGCWASACSRDALARCAETGTDVASVRVGVLLQPFVRFDAGGTARVEPDGAVFVTVAVGGPAGVVSGRAGREVTVGGRGRAGPVPAGIEPEAVEVAAALARASAAAAGARSIEWGSSGDRVHLLQVGPEPVPWSRRAGAPPPAALPPGAERLATVLSAFPGPLGEELVLPWALGCSSPPRPAGVRIDDQAAAVREARSLAERLARDVAGVPGGPASAIGSLRGGRVGEALLASRALAEPDPAAAGRLLGLLAAIADALAAAGRLPDRSSVWRLSIVELERALAGDDVAVRRGPDRWEPVVAEIVRARGRRVVGRPVAPGLGAGPARVVRRLREATEAGPPRASRSVLVAPRPWPQLAPLLWHSAGLVTLGGAAGAHLFEVARSLGVPAVAGAHLDGLSDDALLAVDGDSGRVSVVASGSEPKIVETG